MSLCTISRLQAIETTVTGFNNKNRKISQEQRRHIVMGLRFEFVPMNERRSKDSRSLMVEKDTERQLLKSMQTFEIFHTREIFALLCREPIFMKAKYG